MERTGRIFWALLLAAVLLLNGLPAAALAENAENTEQTRENAPAEEISEETPEESVEETALPGLYFGLLHAHTKFSDGDGTLEEVLADARENLDFLGLTDHSDSLTGEEWAAAETAVHNASSAEFAALRGYEMSWPEGKHLGHISTFGTRDFVSWTEDPYREYTGLDAYYAALAADTDAVAQFQHPTDLYGTFHNFAYNADADRAISLLEVAWEGETCFNAYTAALDKGWHVAPTWGGWTHDAAPSFSAGRTVVQVDGSLTEENLKSALKNRRVYATGDGDLQILYSLDGFGMGEILPLRLVGPTAEIDVTLFDPTDEAIGRVEVVGPGNAVAATVSVDANPERITLSVPSDRAYYFLRVVQPDGDIALTAPVWINQTERVGIFSLTGPEIVVQGSEISLDLTLFNEETAALEVSELALYLDGEPVGLWQTPFAVAPGSTTERKLTYTHGKLGQGELTLQVTAALSGQPRSYAQTLCLSAWRKDTVTRILVDGSHGNEGLDSLSELHRLASGENLEFVIARDTITEEMLADCALVMISAPGETFPAEFTEIMKEYVTWGGTLLVCAEDPAGAGVMNNLLSGIGATARFGGELPEHRPREFNREDPLCAGVLGNQLFYLKRGCAVDPGAGTWLVKGQDVLMARENLAEGTVLVCGSLIMEEEALKEPDYLWDAPYANRSIVQALLGAQPESVELSTVSRVRQGQPGEIYRIRGYVTASTFPETLFLQDKTGGIAVTPYAGQVPGIGRAVEVTGVLEWQEGQPILSPIGVEFPETAGYRYQPRSMNCREARNGAEYSGQVVQVSGICADRVTEGGVLREFRLKDSTGYTLRVVIGETIVSSQTGKNTLHETVEKGEEIWAVGILQTDEEGETWLRVRNCDEVVAVAPNPYTGDGIILWITAMGLSALVPVLLKKKCRARG